MFIQVVRKSKAYSLSPVLGSKYKYAQGSIRITSPEYNVYIKNGSVLGPQGWLLDKNGGFFEELTHSDRKGHRGGNSLYLRRRFPELEQLSGSFITLCYPYSTNWYHWLIQSIPRLYLVKDLLNSVDGIIVPSSFYHQRLIESLKFFGVSPSKIHVLGNRHLKVDTLIVPHYFAQSNIPSWLPHYFRESALNQCVEKKRKRLYISREDVKTRRCTNEADLTISLEKLGFEVLQLSAINFSEQAVLFASAEIVIGSHGAGLSNVAFCPEGSDLVEVFPSKNTHSDLFHSIACAAKMNYWRFEGESNLSSNIHSDYSVDVEKMLTIVNKILAQAT